MKVVDIKVLLFHFVHTFMAALYIAGIVILVVPERSCGNSGIVGWCCNFEWGIIDYDAFFSEN